MASAQTDESTSATWDTDRAVLVDAIRLASVHRTVEELLGKIGDEASVRTVQCTVRYSDAISHTTSSLVAVTNDLNSERSEIVGVKVNGDVYGTNAYRSLGRIEVEFGRGVRGVKTVALQVTGTDRTWVGSTRGALRETLKRFLLAYDDGTVGRRAGWIVALVSLVVVFVASLPALRAWLAGRSPTTTELLLLLCWMVSAFFWAVWLPDGVKERLIRWYYPMASFAIGEGKDRYEAFLRRRRTTSTVIWFTVVLGLVVSIVGSAIWSAISR